MSNGEKKCVMVADESLPTGVLANTAAILGITLGKWVPECVGEDVYDATGRLHRGIIEIPVPILKGNRELLRTMRETLYTHEYEDVWVVDFSDVAQGCITYEEYMEKVAKVPEADHVYLAMVLYGDKKKVNRLTGSLPLLR